MSETSKRRERRDGPPTVVHHGHVHTVEIERQLSSVEDRRTSRKRRAPTSSRIRADPHKPGQHGHSARERSVQDGATETHTKEKNVMSTIESPPVATRELRPTQITRRSAFGGSTAEALLGLAAVVLSILAIAGVLVVPLAAIAVITVAAALLFESAAIATGPGASDESEAARAMAFSGAGADLVTGMAALILGVLALIGIGPLTLLPVSILVLGAGLLFSGASMIIEQLRSYATAEVDRAQNAISGAASIHVIVGAGALILGVLGVVGPAPILVTLIGTMSVGFSLLLSGAALGARLPRMARHAT
jgi:hypothetical protein